MYVDIEYTGNGQAICHATYKDVMNNWPPREIVFGAP